MEMEADRGGITLFHITPNTLSMVTLFLLFDAAIEVCSNHPVIQALRGPDGMRELQPTLGAILLTCYGPLRDSRRTAWWDGVC